MPDTTTATRRLTVIAWNDAVRSWRRCWEIRKESNYSGPAVESAETDMDDDALFMSRLSGWQLCSPAVVACGG